MVNKILAQLKGTDLEAISGLDATFLYAETPTSPMHIGSVAVLEGSLDFDKFKATILSRIHTVPNFRKRLVYVPLSIDYPYWVDDPNFDIEMHVHHIALPKPGDWKSLRKVANQIFSEPLDQSRPLWSFTFASRHFRFLRLTLRSEDFICHQFTHTIGWNFEGLISI